MSKDDVAALANRASAYYFGKTRIPSRSTLQPDIPLWDRLILTRAVVRAAAGDAAAAVAKLAPIIQGLGSVVALAVAGAVTEDMVWNYTHLYLRRLNKKGKRK